MRNLLVLSAAASALALVSTHHVAALSPGASATNPQGLVHKAQKSDDTPGARGKDGAQRGAEPGNRGGGAEPGKRSEDGTRAGAAQDKGETRGTNMRTGEKGTRGTQQRGNVNVNVDRGRHGHRDRVDRRTRVGVAVEDRRRSGRGAVDVGVRGYGYSPANCQEILRRYRQCTAR
jgi:hypothetical protein